MLYSVLLTEWIRRAGPWELIFTTWDIFETIKFERAVLRALADNLRITLVNLFNCRKFQCLAFLKYRLYCCSQCFEYPSCQKQLQNSENRLLVNILLDVYVTVQLPDSFFSVLASTRNLVFGTFVAKCIQKWGLWIEKTIWNELGHSYWHKWLCPLSHLKGNLSSGFTAFLAHSSVYKNNPGIFLASCWK